MTFTHKQNFDNWLSWRPFRMDISKQRSQINISTLCENLGFTEYVDFIVKQNEIRCANNEMLGILKINLENK